MDELDRKEMSEWLNLFILKRCLMLSSFTSRPNEYALLVTRCVGWMAVLGFQEVMDRSSIES